MNIPPFLLKLSKGVLKNILYVALFFGILFLALGYGGLFHLTSESWKEVFKVAGTVILSSGVFMAIAKSEQFLGIFKDELRNVIYSREHLDKRKDLNAIWYRVSESLCKQKFATINTKVFETVKEHYLPFDQEFFYKRFEIDSAYEFMDNEPEYLSVDSEYDTDIVADDPDGFTYHFSSTIPLPENDNGRTSYELEEMKINGEILTDLIEKEYLKIKRTEKALSIKFDYHIPCEKTKEYKITRRDKTTYNLNSNPFNAHSASWLYKMFVVKITYPKEINIDWVDIGVLGRWTKNLRENNVHNVLKATYNGLVFKNQGFMIIFRKI
ncbi:hypothetical protein [Maribacter sp.]|uniref:hypothetical protein n=1 Tax=Maribacter sp. TaxID=1897614 RepID=UPI0025B8A21F|nr:hypothetical protein [Maribacter sp.]